MHLSNQKLPIIGDGLYNSRNHVFKDTPKDLISHIQNFPRQALHASKIKFPSINSKDLFEFQVDIPDDIQSLIKLLK